MRRSTSSLKSSLLRLTLPCASSSSSLRLFRYSQSRQAFSFRSFVSFILFPHESAREREQTFIYSFQLNITHRECDWVHSVHLTEPNLFLIFHRFHQIQLSIAGSWLNVSLSLFLRETKLDTSSWYMLLFLSVYFFFLLALEVEQLNWISPAAVCIISECNQWSRKEYRVKVSLGRTTLTVHQVKLNWLVSAWPSGGGFDFFLFHSLASFTWWLKRQGRWKE